MSDKSFGDCTNRNVVKNPLLSTAVTGLSIEDLTHNAVLLPAVPSQELITIQDQQNVAQNITLRHLDHDITNFPSGDAASYQTQYKSPPHITNSLLDNQKQTENIKTNENLITTKSKASLKTDDDFDVNEYFARLQGTRYVSAPLNSHLKEDQNANLQAEENLEEINLNEPEKKQNQDDFQQSLTADIAQNFSQLPSVLPQVASAVFSSFSNMLNLKSREQTPDEVKMYQHAQIPEMTVPLAVPDPPAQAMPPPLKEPPISGNTSNYRITTKKKVYAQIPGLSSGDNHSHSYNTVPIGQTPYYFTPEPTVSENKQESFYTSLDQSQSQEMDRIQVKSIQGTEETFDAFNKKTAELSRDLLIQPKVIADHEHKETNPINEFQQETFKPVVVDTKVHENIYITQTQVETMPSKILSSNQNREDSKIQDSFFSSVKNNEMQFSIDKSQVDLHHSSNQFVPISQVSTSIIPPPPMFSSIPRKDSLSTGKSILPPSVARRIGSNQPVIKSSTTTNTILPENIFIPNILPELQSATGEMHTNLQQHIQQDPVYNIPIGPKRTETDTKIGPQGYLGSSCTTPGFNPFIQTPVTATSQNILNESIITPPKITEISSIRPQKDLSKAEKENSLPISNISWSDNNQNPSKSIDNNIIQQVEPETNIAPPMFFNPTNVSQPNIGSSIIKDQTHLATQNIMPPFYSNDFRPEPPKRVPEPPKVSSSLNYRMTKKRPQYYSGPIEGMGSISNNIKPTINPVQANAYQGALFNPDQVQSGPNVPVIYDAPNQQEPLAPFDISRSVNIPSGSTNDSHITQKQMAQTDFNTAFDLSRPTTERYEQTQPQESKGFGIIGSLKSKLSSIDINKIQNTVTTFFDPAYNEPKADPNKEEEINFQTYSGNYQNFPQQESASLEVFVPNTEHGYQTANPYNYQMQTLQTYQNQQYYPDQEYFNQSQNYSKDFYSGYHENPNQSEARTNIMNVVEENRCETDIGEIKIQSTNIQTFFDAATSSNQVDTDCIVEAKQKTIDNISQVTDKNKSVLDDFTLTVGAKRDENVLSHLNPIVDSDIQKKIKETEVSDSLLKKYYGPSKSDIQSTSSLFKEVNIEDIPSDVNEQDTSNNDIIHQLQSVADSTLKNVFDCKSPIVVESVLEKDIIEPFSTISNASIDPSFTPFFDYQQPIFAIPENNIKPIINDPPVNVDSTHTFFDYQVPISNTLPRVKDEYTILNSANTQDAIISNTLEMLSGATEFNNLLQSKSENLQANASAVYSGKSTLNETPLFSLFDQPSILPPLPSFDLTKISSISLPFPINESTEIKNLETKMDNVSLYEKTENITKFERKSSFFDKTLPVEDDAIFVDNQVSDLNICETCREVNKPEEKEADLTTQLIENITAPIQLANPVEFPVIASTSIPDISDFSNQFAEISYIPEDIIETMKQPPSVEPKEENFNSTITFGWSTGESQPAKALTDHDYNFQTDPNVIGFFDDKSLFFENVPTNASDEIKAEYKISQEDILYLLLRYIVLPRQLSIPTAPPEEDSNSDESGLDVHSIEQDAKNDFPIYEEFVIEPSETDDDKIEFKERERYSEDSPQNVDTFTNRVERFKQMETSTEPQDVYEAQKTTNALSLVTSSSPAITIASYFDTGNYAVENHYKNSLTSPPSVSFGANISAPTSIPPGFEEEYKRKRSGISLKDIPIGINVGNISFIPDTATQTPVTVCLTFTQPSNVAPTNAVTTDVSARTTNYVQEAVLTKTERLPAFSSIIEPKSETVEHVDKLSSVEKTATETKSINDTLSDSINFFSSNEESNVNSDVYNNFSRLSSYFTTPPKPEHSKSFFELSQSQNHYRHKPDQFDSIQSKVKDFFDSSNLNKKEASDIPQNYLASMNLVRDLASHKNVTPKEDIVKIVNYFTVSYDIDNMNIGEPKSSLDLNEKRIDNTDGLNELGDIDDTNICIENLLKHCKYCYDTIKKIDLQSTDLAYKVKNCMDNSESKNGEANMTSRQENDKKSVIVNFSDSPFEETNEKNVVTSENRNLSDYDPVNHHWFYRVDYEGKSIWRGFSVTDSRALENAYISPDLNETTVVATDGGRFDVNVVGRLRIPVYWNDKPTNVMRCSWFYKGNIDARYVPYSEVDAEKLEEEYKHGVTTGEWHRRLMLPNNEMVVMHGPAVMVHFLQGSPTDGFGSTPLFTFGKRVYRNTPKINVAGDQPIQIDHLIFLVHGAGEYRHQREKIQSMMRPRVVRRGYVESEIEDTEPSSIDHLLLLCHGVGSACDMRFRSVEEVVDDFRTTSLQLIQSHYKNSYDSGVIGRVEVLPISWHSSLHSGETGVDRRLAAVTLESIPRLRNFTNDTILDVLFYTSPVYCQTIVNTVCKELNRIYELFKTRNPNFNGGVSLGGHSLGSVILYDLLCHQTPESLKVSSNTKHYVPGTAGTGQPTVMYPGLVFKPDALYALGSPIAIFECIRGVETLGQDFCLPTCKNFFNIFHPYDPIAYRLEPMINPLLRDVKPSLIPHHKGRKRMHLELKDTMVRVGADIKQKLIESIRNTWSSMWRTSPPPEQHLEKVREENRRERKRTEENVVEEIEKEELTADNKEEHGQYEATPDTLGRLNNGRRIDHVLQEAPFEIFNEYLFAMTSHVCYWESEDTMLVMLREIYNTLGVSPDCSLPQHTMTVERTRPLDDTDSPTSPADFPSTSRGTS